MPSKSVNKAWTFNAKSLNAAPTGGVQVTNADAVDLPAKLSRRSALLHILGTILAAAAIHAGFFGGGITLVGDIYLQIDPPYNIQLNILTPAAVVGCGLWMTGVVAGPLSVGFVLLALRRFLTTTSGSSSRSSSGGGTGGKHSLCGLRGILALLALIITGGCAAFAAYCWVSLVQFTETFNINPPDSLRQLLGGMAFSAYVPVTLMSLCISAGFIMSSSSSTKGGSNNSTSSSKAYTRPHQPDSFWDALPGIAGLLATLTGVMFSTTILCCIWNFHAAGYFASTSIYSIIDQNTQWILGPVPTDPNYLQPAVYVKLYEDVVVYFGVVASILCIGVLALQFPTMRRFLHKRLGSLLPLSMQKASGEPHHIHGQNTQKNRLSVLFTQFKRMLLDWFVMTSFGEAFIIVCISGLYAYWFWFFSTGYPRIIQEVQSYNDNYVNMHLYARVMGHMTTLTMSFLTFPATRNSVWESAFGIPFDRMIRHHRALGRLCWVLVTTHMLLWQIKWAFEGKLWMNVFTISTLEVTPCELSGTPCVVDNAVTAGSAHYDNFTVPIAEAAWLLLTVSLLFAGLCRRKNYELFHYTHHVVLLFFLAGLMHAWSNWYYTAVGLILYVFDKITRTIKAARPVEVVSLSHASGVTKLVIRAGAGGRALGKRGHYAGQYVFMNIPAIDSFQWHPFTISSGPNVALEEGIATFHIKDMGEKTWTHSLAELALAVQGTASGGDTQGAIDAIERLPISIDGPYGRTGHYYERDTLLMVAGGIGFTPFHSLLQDLRARATSSDPLKALGNVRRVHLVWVVRSNQMVSMFADTILALQVGTPGMRIFTVTIFSTETTSSSSASAGGTTTPKSLIKKKSSRTNKSGTAALTDRLLSAGSSSTTASDDDEDDPDEQDVPSALHHHHHRGTGGAENNIYSGPNPVAAGWVDAGTAGAVNAQVKTGRPNLPVYFREAIADVKSRLSLENNESNNDIDLTAHVTTMVCGPENMIAECSSLALQHRTDFHSEVFHF